MDKVTHIRDVESSMKRRAIEAFNQSRKRLPKSCYAQRMAAHHKRMEKLRRDEMDY